MPAYVSKKGGNSNVVKRKFTNLPENWVFQEIALNYSFQGFPTVTIRIEGIPEKDYPQVLGQFQLGSKRNFNGITFEVVQIGWTEQKFEYLEGQFSTYNLNINYEIPIKRKIEREIKVKELGPFIKSGAAVKTKKDLKNNKKKPKVSLRNLCGIAGIPYSGPEALIPIPEDGEDTISLSSIIPDVARSKGCYIKYDNAVNLLSWKTSVGSVSISPLNLIQNGENTIVFPPAYQGVELTWDRSEEEIGEEQEDKEQDPDEKEEEKQLPPRYNFVRAQTKIQTLTEEDVNFSKPPADTRVLRGLDSLAWESGPTRQTCTTTLYDGVEVKSSRTIFGFSYQAHQIAKEDGILFNSTPEKFWVPIEWQGTTRVYEELGLISLRVTGINTATKKAAPLVIHPDYANFARLNTFAAEGYLLSFQPKVEYLTAIITNGAKVMPLERESGKSLDEILDPKENPRAKVQVPIEIPRADKTAYRLGSARVYYKEEDQNQNLPFQVDFKPFQELDLYVQDALRWQLDLTSFTPETLIGLVTPDINYVEPLIVLAESRVTNSFACAADPESTDEDPRPPLVAGEEGYFKMERTILDANKLRENTTQYTATDPGYRASLTISHTSEKSGQAPQAESRPIKYDKTENDDFWNRKQQWQYTFRNRNDSEKPQKPLPRYFCDSDLIEEGVLTGGNLSFPYATSLEEATKAAQVAISMEQLQNGNQNQAVVAWFEPLVDSSRVTIGGEAFRVMSSTSTITQIGRSVKPISGNVQLTEGTQLTLAPEPQRSVSVYKVDDASVEEDPVKEAMNPDQGSVPAGDGQLQAKFVGGAGELGEVLEPDSTRRRF